MYAFMRIPQGDKYNFLRFWLILCLRVLFLYMYVEMVKGRQILVFHNNYIHCSSIVQFIYVDLSR